MRGTLDVSAILAHAQMLAQAISGAQLEFMSEAAHLPNRVWIRYRGRGTHRGMAWGFEPTGKQATYAGVTILYFNEGGKIIDRWGAFCFYDIFADLELVPPFWELSQRLGSS